MIILCIVLACREMDLSYLFIYWMDSPLNTEAAMKKIEERICCGLQAPIKDAARKLYDVQVLKVNMFVQCTVS